MQMECIFPGFDLRSCSRKVQGSALGHHRRERQRGDDSRRPYRGELFLRLPYYVRIVLPSAIIAQRPRSYGEALRAEEIGMQMQMQRYHLVLSKCYDKPTYVGTHIGT